MNRNYQWQIGQPVKRKDDYGLWVYGVVVDKASDCIYILWEDTMEPQRHFQSDYTDIILCRRFTGNNNNKHP